MKSFKRRLAIVLAFVMVVLCAVPATAEGVEENPEAAEPVVQVVITNEASESETHTGSLRVYDQSTEKPVNFIGRGFKFSIGDTKYATVWEDTFPRFIGYAKIRNGFGIVDDFTNITIDDIEIEEENYTKTNLEWDGSKWVLTVAPTCTVTFVDEEGAEIASKSVVIKGATTSLPECENTEDELFYGWVKRGDNDHEIFTEDTPVNSNLTLVATYVKGIKIYYHAMYDDVGIATSTELYAPEFHNKKWPGADYVSVSKPEGSIPNYEWQGKYYEYDRVYTNGKTPFFPNDNHVIETSWDTYKNVGIVEDAYMQWNSTAYIVEFRNEDGSRFAAASSSISNPASISEPDKKPHKTNYTFQYWYEEDSTTPFDFTATISTPTILYPYFTYNGGGSTGGGSAKSSQPAGTVVGTWTYIATADKWTFTSNEGKVYYNEWAYIYNPYATGAQPKASWFFFDANGIMLTGYQWIPSLAGGYRLFFLHPTADGIRGRMYENEATPDGNYADANGWIYVNGVLQVK